jgi:PAS domain S-box-containing protein
MEAAPENIVLTRMADGKIVHANPAFYQRSGWGPEECLGRTTLELNIYVHPEDRDRFVSILKKEGRVEGFQVPVHFKDGIPSVQLWSARVIDIFGEPHLLVVTRDIGELIATREALEESERSYRTILESSPTAVGVWRLGGGPDGVVNEAVVRGSGVRRGGGGGRGGALGISGGGAPRAPAPPPPRLDRRPAAAPGAHHVFVGDLDRLRVFLDVVIEYQEAETREEHASSSASIGSRSSAAFIPGKATDHPSAANAYLRNR